MVVEQPVQRCLATCTTGLLAPLADTSFCAMNSSLQFEQDMARLTEVSETGTLGFIRSLAPPLPVGISAAPKAMLTANKRLPAVNTDNPASVLRLIDFIFNLSFCLTVHAIFSRLLLVTSSDEKSLEHLLPVPLPFLSCLKQNDYASNPAR